MNCVRRALAAMSLALTLGVSTVAGQDAPMPSLRLVDTGRLDSVVVELSVDMADLSTCDVYQVTVEVPYGCEYLLEASSETYFVADTASLRAAGESPAGVKVTAVTPFRKDSRRMIMIVDHTLQARASGKSRFPTGRYVLGRFAIDCSMLGDYDKYKVRVVEGDNTTTFATGRGRETLTPVDCAPLVLRVNKRQLESQIKN